MSTSAVKNISLLLIRIGRWVAKKARLENNSLVLFLYEQVLKGITPPNNSMQSVRYWNHDFISL